jgi:hypothetical protein
MHAPNDNPTPRSTTTWWRWGTPPRPGMRRLIAPWEYRHLRASAGFRIAAGIVLVVLGAVTLTFGGNDWKTYVWTMVFLVAAAAQFSFVAWELAIVRSESPRT